MSAIGNVIEGAIGSAFGANSGTSLQDFLTKFSSADGKWVDTLDPFSSFELTMKFYPDPPKDHRSKKKGILDKLEASAKGAVKNLANNLTGGLVGSIMNSKVKIDECHDKFDAAHKETFLEYLAAANLLVGSEDWIGENAGQVVKPLEL